MGTGHAGNRQHPACVVAVEYLEPDWAQTKACLEVLDAPVFYVNRGGVGSLAAWIRWLITREMDRTK